MFVESNCLRYSQYCWLHRIWSHHVMYTGRLTMQALVDAQSSTLGPNMEIETIFGLSSIDGNWWTCAVKQYSKLSIRLQIANSIHLRYRRKIHALMTNPTPFLGQYVCLELHRRLCKISHNVPQLEGHSHVSSLIQPRGQNHLDLALYCSYRESLLSC